jgi:hypothetical protein
MGIGLVMELSWKIQMPLDNFLMSERVAELLACSLEEGH